MLNTAVASNALIAVQPWGHPEASQATAATLNRQLRI
jgi:hypothetical protein